MVEHLVEINLRRGRRALCFLANHLHFLTDDTGQSQASSSGPPGASNKGEPSPTSEKQSMWMRCLFHWQSVKETNENANTDQEAASVQET